MGWHFNGDVEWGWAQALSAGVESRPCTLQEKFLEVLEDIEIFCVSNAVWDIKHYILYLGKNIHFTAVTNAQSKMPLLHHTHSSHSLMVTSRTTSRNICSSFLPHPSFPPLVTEGTYTGSSGAVSFTDTLGSYHKWLTKTSINYSAEDSRDLPPPSSPLWLDSSNVKPAAGSRSARRWLEPHTPFPGSLQAAHRGFGSGTPAHVAFSSFALAILRQLAWIFPCHCCNNGLRSAGSRQARRPGWLWLEL